MSFLEVTLPLSLLLAGLIAFLAIRAAWEGQYDDWEGPAWRHAKDDDRIPEIDPAANPAATHGDEAR